MAASYKLAALLEEVLQDRAALVGQQATLNFEAVIEGRAVAQVNGATQRTGFRVVRAEYHASDARLHDCANAHRARFQRHV